MDLHVILMHLDHFQIIHAHDKLVKVTWKVTRKLSESTYHWCSLWFAHPCIYLPLNISFSRSALFTWKITVLYIHISKCRMNSVLNSHHHSILIKGYIDKYTSQCHSFFMYATAKKWRKNVYTQYYSSSNLPS